MPMTAKWSSADVPSQAGRVAVITGSNTGVGYETAVVLADKGAHVVLAIRNLVKGEDAKAQGADAQEIAPRDPVAEPAASR